MKEFDKIIGYDSIKSELEKIVDMMKNPDKYKKLGAKLPTGIILYGEPGVGKTLFANCFIKASKRKAFVCRKNKSVGQILCQITRTFEEASNEAPSIILLDDLDKFANEDYNHRDAEEYVTVQSCIDEYKDRDILVVATANDLSKIPRSLIRAGRFDVSIEVQNPKGEDAEKIVGYYLSQKKYVAEIDAREVARILNGRSCAELEAIINQAGIYAGFENKKKIDFHDIVRACMRSIYDSPDTIRNEQKSDNLVVAYHEAGHAVVAELLEPESVTLVSIDNREGAVGGFTAYYKDEQYWNEIGYMENRVCTLLGGRAAVEMEFGKTDVGCSADMSRALTIIHRLIVEYGSTGFDKCSIDYHVSHQLKYIQEHTADDELVRFYNKAKRLLAENRDFYEAFTQELITKRVLVSKDIQEIKKRVFNSRQNVGQASV